MTYNMEETSKVQGVDPDYLVRDIKALSATLFLAGADTVGSL
jgi:hypothetical protein